MEMETVLVKPSEIIVGERLRRDLGDTQDLERSIRKLGLLQPIGVTKDNMLVWGKRRLEVWKKIYGDEPIPATVVASELSNMAELAENICRLDLPWHLKDLAIAELHKKLEADAIKELLSESDGNSPPTPKLGPGAPAKAWTYEDTASVLGVSRAKVSTAIALSHAIEENPSLVHVESEEKALDSLKKVVELKEEKPSPESVDTKEEWECPVCHTVHKLYHISSEPKPSHKLEQVT